MRHETYCNTPDTLSQAKHMHVAEDYVWATSEEAKQRALSLYNIRSIVERHGGTLEIDMATDTININVPENERVACAQEIEEHVGAMCH